jgi:hypothetical protein
VGRCVPSFSGGGSEGFCFTPMTIKRPSFQFYPSDWRNDSGLRLCSLAARGLWVEMMCIAHESEEYGKLKQNGRGFSHKTLAKLVGLSPQTCLKLLKELEENKVFSRDEDGAIYSRRMVRDEHIRKIRAEAGVKGGNPLLLGHLVKQNGKQKPTPSSSSSSSLDSKAGVVWQEPTREQVIEAGRNVGLTEQQAGIWYDEMKGRDIAPNGRWLDGRGNPIGNWQYALSAWAGRFKENNRKGKTYANNGTSGASRLRSYSGVNKPEGY